VLEWADEGYASVILLPHEHDWGPRIMGLLVRRGHGNRVFDHRLSETRKVMKFCLLPYSRNPDPLERIKEVEDTINGIRNLVGYKREIDFERQALIDETFGLSLQLLMSQPKRYMLSDLLESTFPRSPLHKQLREECTNPNVLMRLDAMRAGVVNERQTWGPIQRLVHQFLGSNSIALRESHDSPLEDTLERGAIHIFEGGNNARVTSTFFNLVRLNVIAFLDNRWSRNGKEFPLLLIRDETQGF